MRLLNKIAVGASAFAFAAAITAGVVASPAPVAKANGDQTQAAASFKDKIKIHYESSCLQVNGTNDHKITVSYPTVDKKGVLSADKNICTYDVNSESGVAVDLSTLNVTKDNYIKIVGDVNTDPIVIKIAATDQLGKGTASATDGAISVTTKADRTKFYDATKLQYATSSSNWSNYYLIDDEDSAGRFEDLSPMLQLGATLRVRVAPYDWSANGHNYNTQFKTKSSTIEDKAKVVYPLYEAVGNLPGKEIKVKIPKMANAPKATVDYAKRVIKIAKGCEYRINTKSGLGKWTSAGDKVAELKTLDLTKDGNLDVRKAADEKRNKPASKYSVTSWKGIYTFGVEYDTKENTASLVSSCGTIGNKTEAITGGAVTVKVESKKSDLKPNGNVKTATSSTITITNKSKLYSYEYYLADKGATAPIVTTKGKAIGVAKSSSDRVVPILFKDVRGYKDKDIYIRRVAVKTKGNEQWVTDWVKLATVTDKAYTVTFAGVDKTPKK